MFSIKRKLYEALPTSLKVPICWVPFEYLAGGAYRRTVRRHASIDRATRPELIGFQEAALGDVLRFACSEIPAYETFRAVVNRLRPLEAIRAFPFLDKATLQSDLDRFLPRTLASIRHYEATTGGTSGNQLRILLDDHSQATETAFMHRLWMRVGYHPRCRKATFRGVEFRDLRKGCYWQLNPIYREWQFSPYHMNEGTLPAYVEQLQRSRVAYVHGYPSAIGMLARFILHHGIPPASFAIKAVLLCSEAVLPEQREQIERAFGARVFSWYGHSERLILAGECEHTTAYHHFPDYGLLEIVDDAGNVVTGEGDEGEIVGTGFWNRSLPLIRYRTEDRARRLDHHCTCGRNFDRFDEVQGRWKQEHVIGKSGSQISMAALNVHGPEFARVLRYQFYQKERGTVELRVMVTPEFSDADAQALRNRFARKVSDELMLNVRVVENIPLTNRGKLRRLVQDIRSSAEATDPAARIP